MQKVDVVIPTFNRPTLTLQAIESVLNQDYDNIDLYVIEDGPFLLNNRLVENESSSNGSPENTLNNNPEFCNRVKSNKLHHIKLTQNRGPSYCRNLGAKKGNGQLLAFLDSDDLWKPGKITKQVNFLNDNPSINWVHTNETWIRNGQTIKQKRVHKKQGGIFVERLMERCLISASTVMFRKPFFLKSGGFLNHFRVAEDYELWLRLNGENPIGFLEEELAIKQAGEWDQLSSTPSIDKLRVLALHRYYRMNRHKKEFYETKDINNTKSIKDKLFKELEKKTRYLIKGAEKYNQIENLKKYQRWANLFDIIRIRSKRAGLSGTRKYSRE